MPNIGAEPVVVAVGVLIQAARVLVAQRPEGVHLANLWEFPGGKIEPGENVEAALKREFTEELGIQIFGLSPLTEIYHTYPEKQVLLKVYSIEGFAGEPRGCEGQLIMWCDCLQLLQLRFPAANWPILDLVNKRLQLDLEASSR